MSWRVARTTIDASARLIARSSWRSMIAIAARMSLAENAAEGGTLPGSLRARDVVAARRPTRRAARSCRRGSLAEAGSEHVVDALDQDPIAAVEQRDAQRRRG